MLALILAVTWVARWIGPASETRPDEDFGMAEWISAPAGDKGAVTLDFSMARALRKKTGEVL